MFALRPQLSRCDKPTQSTGSKLLSQHRCLRADEIVLSQVLLRRYDSLCNNSRKQDHVADASIHFPPYTKERGDRDRLMQEMILENRKGGGKSIAEGETAAETSV